MRLLTCLLVGWLLVHSFVTSFRQHSQMAFPRFRQLQINTNPGSFSGAEHRDVTTEKQTVPNGDVSSNVDVDLPAGSSGPVELRTTVENNASFRTDMIEKQLVEIGEALVKNGEELARNGEELVKNGERLSKMERYIHKVLVERAGSEIVCGLQDMNKVLHLENDEEVRRLGLTDLLANVRFYPYMKMPVVMLITEYDDADVVALKKRIFARILEAVSSEAEILSKMADVGIPFPDEVVKTVSAALRGDSVDPSSKPGVIKRLDCFLDTHCV